MSLHHVCDFCGGRNIQGGGQGESEFCADCYPDRAWPGTSKPSGKAPPEPERVYRQGMIMIPVTEGFLRDVDSDDQILFLGRDAYEAGQKLLQNDTFTAPPPPETKDTGDARDGTEGTDGGRADDPAGRDPA